MDANGIYNYFSSFDDHPIRGNLRRKGLGGLEFAFGVPPKWGTRGNSCLTTSCVRSHSATGRPAPSCLDSEPFLLRRRPLPRPALAIGYGQAFIKEACLL